MSSDTDSDGSLDLDDTGAPGVADEESILDIDDVGGSLVSADGYVNTTSVGMIAVHTAVAAYGPQLVDLLVSCAKDAELLSTVKYLLDVYRERLSSVEGCREEFERLADFGKVADAVSRSAREKIMPVLKDATIVNLALKVEQESRQFVSNSLSHPVDPDKIGLLATNNSKVIATSFHLPDLILTDGKTEKVVTGTSIENNILVLAHFTQARPIKEDDQRMSVNPKHQRASPLQFERWCNVVKHMYAAHTNGEVLPVVKLEGLRSVANALYNKYVESGNRANISSFKGIFMSDKMQASYNNSMFFKHIPELRKLDAYLADPQSWDLGPKVFRKVAEYGYTTKDLIEDRDFRAIGKIANLQQVFEIFAARYRTSPIEKFLVVLKDFFPIINALFAVGHSDENRWLEMLRRFGANILDKVDLPKDGGNYETINIPDFNDPIDTFDAEWKKEAIEEEMKFEAEFYARVLLAEKDLSKSMPPKIKSLMDSGPTIQQIDTWYTENSKDLSYKERVWVSALKLHKLQLELIEKNKDCDVGFFDPRRYSQKFDMLLSDVYFKKSEDESPTAQIENVEDEEMRVWKMYFEWVKSGRIVCFKWLPTKHKKDKGAFVFDWHEYLLTFFEGHYVRVYFHSRRHNGEIMIVVIPSNIMAFYTKTGAKHGLDLQKIFLVNAANVEKYVKTVQVNMAFTNSLRNLLLSCGISQTAYYSGLVKFCLRLLNPDVVRTYCAPLEQISAVDVKQMEKDAKLRMHQQRLKLGLDSDVLPEFTETPEEKAIRKARETLEAAEAKKKKEDATFRSSVKQQKKKTLVVARPKTTAEINAAKVVRNASKYVRRSGTNNN